MRSLVGKIFRIFLLLTMVLFGSGSVLFIMSWFYPSIIVNESTVRIAGTFLADSGIYIDLSGLKVNARSISLLKKGIDLEVDHGSFYYPKAGIDISSGRLKASSQFRIAYDSIKFVEMGPLWVENARVLISSGKRKAEKSKDAEEIDLKFNFPDLIRGARLNSFEIVDSAIKIKNYAGSYSFKMNMHNKIRDNDILWNLDTEAFIKDSKSAYVSRPKIEIRSSKKLNTNNVSISAKGGLTSEGTNILALEADIDIVEGGLGNFDMKVDADTEIYSLTAGIKGSKKGPLTSSIFSAVYKNKEGPFKRIELDKCSLVFSNEVFRPDGGRLGLECKPIFFIEEIRNLNILSKYSSPLKADISMESSDFSLLRPPYRSTGKLYAKFNDSDGKHLKGKLDGKFKMEGLDLKVAVKSSLPIKELDSVELKNCGGRTGWDIFNEKGSNPSFKCQSSVNISKDFFKNKDIVPEILDASTTIDLREFSFLDMSRITGAIDLKLSSISNAVFDLSGHLRSDFDIPVKRAIAGTNLKLDSDISMKIKKWETIQNIMEDLDIRPPAPLNDLKGTVLLKIRGKSKADSDSISVPLKLLVDLHSEEQKLKIDADGKAVFKRDKTLSLASIELNTYPSNTVLVLPPLSIKDKIRLSPDPRINRASQLKGEPEKPKKEPVKYKVIVDTRGNPVKLKSSYVEDEIPLNIDLIIRDNEPLEGSLNFSRFTAEIFRRKGTVEYFNIKFLPEYETQEIEGRISVDYSDYVIYINVTGSTKQPYVTFDSSPPMTREEIISVLMFGSKIEDLDNDKSSSVGNMNAAVADRAVNLMSMYILASTPIQSVGYNPQTKVFTAKLNLGFGTTVYYGSDWDDYRRVGIKKRLGSNWSIKTYTENPTNTDKYSITTLLEWFTRY